MRRAALLVLLGVAACGTAVTDEVDAGHKPIIIPSDVCIALDRDFASFRNWTRHQVAHAAPPPVLETDGGVEADAGTSHLEGDRFVYINHVPPGGSTEFPLCTMIVKTVVEANGQESLRAHAMVKRNGGYNDQGAVGWEWMELRLDPSRDPFIVWRGPGPPGVSGYKDPLGGDSADCNTCHAAARDNDFVRSPALRLRGE